MATKNKGQQYEDSIRELLRKRNLLPADLAGNDAGFIHKGRPYYLEVKNRAAPDFGQSGLVWNRKSGWEWRRDDIVTELFNDLRVMDFIPTDFIPRRHSVARDRLMPEDRSYDQARFERSNITLSNIDCLYEYYARKQCFYLQIEGQGFFHLKRDAAGLGVPRFNAPLTLRLRAKTHHSEPVYMYSFFAVIRPDLKRLRQSAYDLESKVGRFPPIEK